MRCEEIIRELSAPTGTIARSAVDDHLAHCPACAQSAVLGERLDRLWAATRPAPLAPEAWDRIWAKVSDAYDRRDEPAPAPILRVRPWRRPAIAAFALAQAAVILIAVFMSRPSAGPQQPGREAPVVADNRPVVAPSLAVTPSAVVTPAPAVAAAFMQIPQGETVLLKFDESHPSTPQVQVLDDLALNDNPNAVDPFYAMYNTVEALAALQ